MKRTAVIMAGGSGERFWPLSRKSRPKQLLPLISDKVMLEESINRIAPLIPPEDVFIITSRVLLEPIRSALKIIPPENVIAEPYKRNTAPCLALAAAFIGERYSETHSAQEISIAVLTADQSITTEEQFLVTCETALNFVEENPALATIGIPPSRPETGYGYIEVDTPFDLASDIVEIKNVVRFREKPDVAQAIEFLEAGNYLWNSGMFFWRLDTFRNSMEKHLPEVGLKIDDMQMHYAGKTREALDIPLEDIAPIFDAFPDISIDYGLMEKAGNVVTAKALFSWDDIGSWDSLERIKPKDSEGNISEGTTSIVDSHNCIILNKSTGKEMIIGAIGMENVVVVVTDDAVMLCPKTRVQEVKKCVEKLRKDGGEKWL